MTRRSSRPEFDQGASEGNDRDREADVREVVQDARDDRLDAREAATAKRARQVERILAAADKRDHNAQARDAAASGRDMAASLSEFLDNPPDTRALQARGAAALDRSDSRADRAASKGDRHELAEGEPPAPKDG